MTPPGLTSKSWLLLGASLCAIPAMAQEDDFFARDRYESVTERAQPEFDPVPIRGGVFELRPEAQVGVGTRSNLFASDANEEGDTFFVAAPSLNGQSLWSRNSLSFGARLGHTEYFDNGDESNTTYGANVLARVDASSALSFEGGVSFDQLVEPRFAAASQPDASEPVEFQKFGGLIGANYKANRVELRGRLSIDDFDFDDVALRAGGVRDQDFRDATETTLSARGAFAVERDWAVFAEARQVERDYDNQGGLNRDSSGTIFEIGTNFELPVLLRGEVAVGYQDFDYDDPAFSGVSGLSLDADVQWFVSELTTLSGRASRDVVDPGLATSAGSTLSSFGARADHELRRNLLVFGDVQVDQYDFEDINREDDRFTAGVGTTWKINRNAWVEGSYRYVTQDSDFDEFNDNQLLVALRVFP